MIKSGGDVCDVHSREDMRVFENQQRQAREHPWCLGVQNSGIMLDNGRFAACCVIRRILLSFSWHLCSYHEHCCIVNVTELESCSLHVLLMCCLLCTADFGELAWHYLGFYEMTTLHPKMFCMQALFQSMQNFSPSPMFSQPHVPTTCSPSHMFFQPHVLPATCSSSHMSMSPFRYQSQVTC